MENQEYKLKCLKADKHVIAEQIKELLSAKEVNPKELKALTYKYHRVDAQIKEAKNG